MKARLLAAALFIAGIICLGQQAQSQLTLTGVGADFSGGAVVAWSGFGNGNNACGGFPSSCTLATGQTIVTGFVVAQVGWNGSGSVTQLSNITICGTALSLVKDSGLLSSGSMNSSLWAGNVTGGASCSVVINHPAATLAASSAAWGTLTGLISTTPSTTCAGFSTSLTNPIICSSALTVSAGGFAIIGVASNQPNAFTAPNFTIDSTQTAVNPAILIGHNTASLTPQVNQTTFAVAGIEGGTWH